MWDLVWIRGFLELGFCWHSSFHTVLLGKLPKRAWPRRPAPSQRTSWGLAGWCPSRSSRARKPCRHWVKSGQACGGRLPPGSRPLTPGLLGLCPHLPCLTDLCGFSLLWQLGLTQLGCTALISHFCFYSCPERSTHPINTSGRTLLERVPTGVGEELGSLSFISGSGDPSGQAERWLVIGCQLVY